MPTILITGAAGIVGTMLRPRLARPGRTLRLLDIAPLTARPGQLGAAAEGPGQSDAAAEGPGQSSAAAEGPGEIGTEEIIQASATDMDAMTEACRGAEALIHLAGVSGEASWERIRDVNIQGGYVAFEAARRAGVPRVIFASSNHAVGFTPREKFPVPDYAFPAPDTFYGVSKVATEGLAALYHYRYSLDTICIRILTCAPEPPDRRSLSTWLSPDDAGRLFEACLTAPSPGFRVVFGVSANTRGGFVSLAEAKALGYEPRDDAEVYAAAIEAADPDRGVPDDQRPYLRNLGGSFAIPGQEPPQA